MHYNIEERVGVCNVQFFLFKGLRHVECVEVNRLDPDSQHLFKVPVQGFEALLRILQAVTDHVTDAEHLPFVDRLLPGSTRRALRA